MGGLVVATDGLKLGDSLIYETGLGSDGLIIETSWTLFFNGDNLMWDTDQMTWGTE